MEILLSLIGFACGIIVGYVHGRNVDKKVLRQLTIEFADMETKHAKLKKEVDEARTAIRKTAEAFSKLKPQA
jgi:uncharacterized membrane-anchored protein YhcB (DUF1043 family)